jgi:hypothetical protein
MKMLRNIMLLLTLCVSAAFAQSTVGYSISGSNTTTLLLTGQYDLQSMNIVNGTASPLTIVFHDTATTNRLMTNSGVTEITSSVVLITNVFTDVGGLSITNVWSGISNAVAKVTNTVSKPIIYAVTNLIGSGTVSIADLRYNTSQGLAAYIVGTNAAATVSITTQKMR